MARINRWVFKLVILLMLAGVFAWYFLSPVALDLQSLWALCTGG